MQMRARKTFRYARKPYGPGEPVEIRPQDVRAAVALGWVEYVFAPLPKPTAPTYNRRDMVASQAAPAAAVPATAGEIEIAGLRAEYKTVTGRDAYPAWDADKIREKTAKAIAKKAAADQAGGE